MGSVVPSRGSRRRAKVRTRRRARPPGAVEPLGRRPRRGWNRRETRRTPWAGEPAGRREPHSRFSDCVACAERSDRPRSDQASPCSPLGVSAIFACQLGDNRSCRKPRRPLTAVRLTRPRRLPGRNSLFVSDAVPSWRRWRRGGSESGPPTILTHALEVPSCHRQELIFDPRERAAGSGCAPGWRPARTD